MTKRCFEVRKDDMLMIAAHPGAHVADEIEARGMTVDDLAAALHVGASALHDLIEERADLTAELAWRLGRWMGVEPDYWMRLDGHYRLVRAYQTNKDAIDAVKPSVAA